MIAQTRQEIIDNLSQAFVDILGDEEIPYTEEGKERVITILNAAIEKCYPGGWVEIILE